MSDFRLPGDLTKLSAKELAELKTAARAASDEILTRDTATAPFTMDDAAKLKGYEQAIKSIVDAETVLAQAESAIAADINAARDSISAMFDTAPDQDAGDTNGGADPEPATTTEPELVTASAQRGKTDVRDVLRKPTLNVRLRNMPEGEQPTRKRPTASEDDLIITAASDVPGFPSGSLIKDKMSLVDAFQTRARGLTPTHGSPNYIGVASIKNQFDVVLDQRMSPYEIEDALKRISDPAQLWTMNNEGQGIHTAGGGFCAPPINRYEFFNIACEDGMIDLPTFGVERGGINFPVSPSFADVLSGSFTSATTPWLWTNTDDVSTVTGSPNATHSATNGNVRIAIHTAVCQ